MTIKESIARNKEFLESLIEKVENFVSVLEKGTHTVLPQEMLNDPSKMENFLKFTLSQEQDIVFIPKEIKKIGNDLYIPKTISISLKSVNPFFSEKSSAAGYTRIKINILNENVLKNLQIKNPPDSLITLIKNDQRFYCFIRGDANYALDEVINAAELLGLFEFQVSKSFIKDELVAPSSYWSVWEDLKTVGLYYDVINDPMMMEACLDSVLPIASELPKDIPLTIVEIGAGAGRFSEKFIKFIKEDVATLHYILVEPDHLQITKAKEKLSPLIGKYCQITFVESTVENFSLSYQVHGIFSSGGPLNVMVASQEAAKANLKKYQELLLPGGVIIATGHTPLQVKGKHFEEQGLEMLSYTAPSFIPKKHSDNAYLQQSKNKGGFFGYYQRYVAQKPAGKNPAELQNDNNSVSDVTTVLQGLVL